MNVININGLPFIVLASIIIALWLSSNFLVWNLASDYKKSAESTRDTWMVISSGVLSFFKWIWAFVSTAILFIVLAKI